jgi:hypothetical protein
LLPSHKRLRDSYNLEQNPDLFLEQGYGLSVGKGAFNTRRSTGSMKSTSISFAVTVTRRAFALDLDPDKKATTEKLLLEDARAILEDIWENNFGITGSPIASFNDWEGIQPVRTESNSFLYITLNIAVEYFIL